MTHHRHHLRTDKAQQVAKIGNAVAIEWHEQGLRVYTPMRTLLGGWFGQVLSAGSPVVLPIGLGQTLYIGADITVLRRSINRIDITKPHTLRLRSLRQS